MNFKLCYLFISAFVVLEITAKPGARIIGGTTALAAEFPYAAAIEVRTATSKFFCGGSLVRRAFVLTSGHCVYNATLFTIKLGSISLTEADSNRVTVASSEFVLHPDFDPETIHADLGIIKLRMNVTQTDYLMSAYFYAPPIFEGSTFRILGWGQTSDALPELSERLQYADVVTLSNEECKLVYGNQITDELVCVEGNFNEGTCTGDNGGPLVQRNEVGYFMIVGIASFISANGCESTNPSGFTRITPYYDWIISIIGN